MRLATCATMLLLQCSAWPVLGMKVSVSTEIDPPVDQQEGPVESKEAMDVFSKLWDGMDLNSSELAVLQGNLTFGGTNMTNVEKSLRRPNILNMVMLGPYDAGTNLLIHTLIKNYAPFVYWACGFDKVRIEDMMDMCRVWKHGLNLSPQGGPIDGEHPLDTILLRQEANPADTVLVVMVRSPLSQVFSWQLSPYTLVNCMNRSISSYVEPCTGFDLSWLRLGNHDHASSTSFASTMSIYNQYLAMYKELQRSGRYRNVLLIPYEDLVLAPQDVIADIASSAGWPVRKKVAIVDAPSKHHGHRLGREQAIQKILQRPWLAQYSQQERAVLCGGLDPAAYEGLQENGRGAPEYPVNPYGVDCAGY